MRPMKRIRKVGREWLAALLGLTALGAAFVVYLRENRPPTYRLTISAGSPQGLRHQIAERLAVDAGRRMVGLRVIGT
ncbi:hypothetical protein ACYOEI_32250, partial [Singulisphaera rosea]